jgi:hypothetical protein
MLTQLLTVKDRLKITDVIDDDYLTGLINAASDLFDRHCNRKFARGEALYQEFRGDELEVALERYPIEAIVGFELKRTEDDDWQDCNDPAYVVRFDCIVSLQTALGTSFDQARVTYVGGYVLPGTTPEEWQTALPADVEQACIEQVAFWYRNKDLTGLSSASGQAGSISFDAKSVVAPLHLLPVVQATLEKYRRIQL